MLISLLVGDVLSLGGKLLRLSDLSDMLLLLRLTSFFYYSYDVDLV